MSAIHRKQETSKCFCFSLQESIVGSAYVTAKYIKNVLGYSGKVYMIGSTGLQQELEEQGLQPIGLGVGIYCLLFI